MNLCVYLQRILIGVLPYLGMNPRDVFGDIGVDPGQVGVGTLYPPTDDAPHEPPFWIVTFVVVAEQRASGITLYDQGYFINVNVKNMFIHDVF